MPSNPFLQGLRELAQFLGSKIDSLIAISSNKKLDINLGESTKQLEEASKELAQVAKILSKKESTDHVGLTRAVISALQAVDNSVRRIKLDVKTDTETPKLIKDLIKAVRDKDMIVEAPDFSSLEKEVAGVKSMIGTSDMTKIEKKIDKIYDCIEKLNTTMQGLKFPSIFKLDEMQLKSLRGSFGGGSGALMLGASAAPNFSNIGVGNKSVAAAGTAEVLSTSTKCQKVEITAFETNTGIIVVGGSGVVAAAATRKGTPLSPGNTLTLNIHNLAKIYLDTTVSGDSVSYTWYD